MPIIERGALTIGKFDSMHIGHRKVLATTHDIAEKENRKFVVLTFTNHPFDIIDPEHSPAHLSNERFKIKYFEEISCDVLILVNFSTEIMNISHIDFAEFLNERIKNLHLVLGFDFKFGSGNTGNIKYLREFCKDRENAKLTVIEKVNIGDGIKVSSTMIRNLLKKGDIKKTNEFLQREYYIESIIKKGQQLGRKIGFPTINMYINDMESPKDGVYISKVEIDDYDDEGNIYKGYGMTYAGKCLVSGYRKDKRLIETYIFNFDENVYGKNARIYFLDRIRDVIEFDSLESLKKQLIIDNKECKRKLEEKCH